MQRGSLTAQGRATSVCGQTRVSGEHQQKSPLLLTPWTQSKKTTESSSANATHGSFPRPQSDTRGVVSLSNAARSAAMSSATATEQRSPDVAATSPGYQGSDGAPAERPASTEKEGQAAPSSEPATAKEDAEPSAATAAEEPASEVVNAGAAKPSEEDATPAKEEVRYCCCKFISKERKNRVVFFRCSNIGDLDLFLVGFWAHATSLGIPNGGYLGESLFNPECTQLGSARMKGSAQRPWWPSPVVLSVLYACFGRAACGCSVCVCVSFSTEKSWRGRKNKAVFGLRALRRTATDSIRQVGKMWHASSKRARQTLPLLLRCILPLAPSVVIHQRLVFYLSLAVRFFTCQQATKRTPCFCFFPPYTKRRCRCAGVSFCRGCFPTSPCPLRAQPERPHTARFFPVSQPSKNLRRPTSLLLLLSCVHDDDDGLLFPPRETRPARERARARARRQERPARTISSSTTSHLTSRRSSYG